LIGVTFPLSQEMSHRVWARKCRLSRWLLRSLPQRSHEVDAIAAENSRPPSDAARRRQQAGTGNDSPPASAMVVWLAVHWTPRPRLAVSTSSASCENSPANPRRCTASRSQRSPSRSSRIASRASGCPRSSGATNFTENTCPREGRLFAGNTPSGVKWVDGSNSTRSRQPVANVASFAMRCRCLVSDLVAGTGDRLMVAVAMIVVPSVRRQSADAKKPEAR
jgi:hypothetical protein